MCTIFLEKSGVWDPLTHHFSATSVNDIAFERGGSIRWSWLADAFASFLTYKISKLRLSLGALSTTMSPHSPAPLTTPPSFALLNLPLNLKCQRSFSTFLTNNLILILSQLGLFKKCASVLVPTITNIVNLSLSSGQFHPTLKQSTISPLLKKPNHRQHSSADLL